MIIEPLIDFLSDLLYRSLYSGYLGVYLRSFGLLLVLPLSSGVPGLIQKIPLAMALTGVLSPSGVSAVALSTEGMVMELCFGIFLGLPSAFIVACAEQFGELFDSGRGQTIASAYDPLQDDVSSISGILFKNYLWVTLLVAGVLEQNCAALHASLVQIAPGSIHVGELSTWGYRAILYWAEMLHGLAIGFLPLGMGFLLVEIIHGFVGRFLPGLSLSTESFMIRSVVGYLICLGIIRLDLAEALLNVTVPSGFLYG